MANREFRVVTHKNWLAKTFQDFDAIQDFGFDIDPTTAQDTIWWAPGAWVASAAAAGVELPLLSAGPRWLDALPEKYVGRDVRTMRIESAMYHGTNVAIVQEEKNGPFDIDIFVKLPEAKVDYFEPRVHKYNRHWATTLGQYNLPDGTLIQCQEVKRFGIEARFFIANREVVADSLYKLDDETIWGTEAFDERKSWHYTQLSAMRSYVKIMLRDRDVRVPPGVVIDVGLDGSGSAYVIEANAAWSSGPYDCNPEGVFEAINASHDFANVWPEWRWQPQPVYRQAGPLRIRSNA